MLRVRAVCVGPGRLRRDTQASNHLYPVFSYTIPQKYEDQDGLDIPHAQH